MPKLDEPELNWMEQRIRDYLLPLLSSDFGQPDIESKENVRVTRSILAKQYSELTNTGPIWKPIIILLVYDFGFQLDSVVYGLVIGATGSISLALSNDFYTPELLAEEAFGKSDDLQSEIEEKAQRTVETNVGLAGLAIGFTCQVFAVSGPLPPELVGQSHLQGIMPTWIGFLVASIVVMLLIRAISESWSILTKG